MKRILALLGLMVFLAGCGGGGGLDGPAFIGISSDSGQTDSLFELPPAPPDLDGTDYEMPPAPPSDEPADSDSDLPPSPPGL